MAGDHPFPFFGEHPFPLAGQVLISYSKTGGFAGIKQSVVIYRNGQVIINDRKDRRFLQPSALKELLKMLGSTPGYEAPLSDYGIVADGFDFLLSFDRDATWSDGSSDVPQRVTDLALWLDGVGKYLADCPDPDKPETKDWYAWLNLEPPRPDDLHVTGQVHVPNPSVKAVLVAKEPTGINPEILILELLLVQQPGDWPDRGPSWVETRYGQAVKNTKKKSVQVVFGSEVLAAVDIVEVS